MSETIKLGPGVHLWCCAFGTAETGNPALDANLNETEGARIVTIRDDGSYHIEGGFGRITLIAGPSRGPGGHAGGEFNVTGGKLS